MSKKSITAASSAQDRARAAEELRAAQDELAAWFEARKLDPTTSREIFEGVDYGPFITLSDIEAEGRKIAQKFDYVDYGSGGLSANTGGNAVVMGSNEFFVPGFGSNADTLAVPNNTRVSRNADDSPMAAVPVPTGSGALPGNTSSPPSDSKIYGNGASGSSDRFAPAPNSVDPAGRASDTVPNANNISGSPDERAAAANTVGATATASSDDDSGKDIAGGGSTAGSNTPSRDNTQPVTAPTSEGRVDLPNGETFVTSSKTGSPGTVDVGKYGQNTGINAGESNPKEVAIRPNVLHGYNNWTYNIALYMLTPAQHNALVDSGQVTPETLRHLLIKSGGTGGRGVLGSRKDYHIENLRFTSVMGQNSRTTKSSNNFDLGFDIVEPYGVAFLAELVQAASRIGIEDHLDTAYLLEIKFSGYDDKGTPFSAVPGSGPKYIPIKLINMTFKINSAATIYTVTAVPYAHSPLQDKSEAYVPEGISLSGSTFDLVIANLMAHMNDSEKTKAAEAGREPNSYFSEVFDQDLRNSKLAVTPELPKITFGNSGDETIQIAAGSTLKDAIQTIALHTEFGAKYNTTGTEASAAGNENKTFRLPKVIPMVKLGKYNPTSRLYTKKITYKIETEKRVGYDVDGMPAARAESRGWAKEYNWIFTGKNQDIVDFNAEYNLQYFYIKSNNVIDKGRTSGVPDSAVEFAPGPTTLLQRDNSTTVIQTPAGPKSVRTGGNTQKPAVVSANALGTGTNVANPIKGLAYQMAADHMDNVLNNPNGDMVVVDLTIIGDPDWIPQDASILPHGSAASTDGIVDRHGSIAIDAWPPLLALNFRTPRDYDMISGLMRIDTDQTFVQGKYQVITVTSTFTDGKFEQSLKCVRLQNQDSNDASKLPDLSIGYDEGEVDPRLAAAAGRTDARVSVSAPNQTDGPQ